MVHGRSVTVQRHRHSGNLSPTYQLTGVAAREMLTHLKKLGFSRPLDPGTRCPNKVWVEKVWIHKGLEALAKKSRSDSSTETEFESAPQMFRRLDVEMFRCSDCPNLQLPKIPALVLLKPPDSQCSKA